MNVISSIEYKYEILTLCCWGSFDPGCSFWRWWRDWTRRQACSSHRCGAHIHNHCQTTKHIHTAPRSISACEKGHIVIECVPHPSLISLYNRWPGGLSGTEVHHYYILIKATVDECATDPLCEAVCMDTHLKTKGVCFAYTRTTDLDLPPEHDLHLTKQGKQVPVPITVMTLIYQLITRPEQIN